MKITISRIAAILMGAIILLAISQSIQISRLKTERDQLRKENKSLHEFNEVFQDSIETTTTKLNTEAAKVKVVSMELETVRKMAEDYRLEFIHQFNSVHAKLKNLEAAAQINATNKITIAAPLRDTIFVDSVTGKSFKWADSYNQITGSVLKDSIAINLTSQVPIEGVVIEERENWRLFGKERKWLPFGKKRLNAELTSPNKSVQITKVSILDID